MIIYSRNLFLLLISIRNTLQFRFQIFEYLLLLELNNSLPSLIFLWRKPRRMLLQCLMSLGKCISGLYNYIFGTLVSKRFHWFAQDLFKVLNIVFLDSFVLSLSFNLYISVCVWSIKLFFGTLSIISTPLLPVLRFSCQVYCFFLSLIQNFLLLFCDFDEAKSFWWYHVMLMLWICFSNIYLGISIKLISPWFLAFLLILICGEIVTNTQKLKVCTLKVTKVTIKIFLMLLKNFR